MIRRKRRSVSLLQDPWTSTACLKGNHMWLLREKPPPMSIPSESPSRRGLPRAAVQRAVRGKTSLTWVRFHLVLFFFSFKAVWFFFFFLTLSFLWNLCNYWIFFQSGFDEGCWLAGFFFFSVLWLSFSRLWIWPTPAFILQPSLQFSAEDKATSPSFYN